MAQLKMYFLPGTPIRDLALPEGYTVSGYNGEEDKLAWCECCRQGLIDDDAGVEAFDDRILGKEDINPSTDLFFIDHNGKHIATIAAIYHPEKKIGEVHMVGMLTEYRGKGLGKHLNNIALERLSGEDYKYIFLTTDEWRKGAVKSYLSSGFVPVEYDINMEYRWSQVLEEYGIDSVDMVYEDATPFRKIYRTSLEKKVRIGVFGAGRGKTMMNYCMAAGDAQLVAVCDSYKPALDKAKENYGEGIAYYTDCDEFLKHDMDAVVLANYANEHAPYAVKILRSGKHVLSEVLPVQTMKEAVELIEAVEETGNIYAYAENYCYMAAPRTMKRLYREGKLGKFEYGEGEYVHNCESGWHVYSRGLPEHWRNTMHAFYYCTHSLGPLLHITGMRPVKVTGFELPFNDRMCRMGAKAGHTGIEMVTLENGAVLKSIHGVGPSKNSVWYSIYGSKGRMESAREDAENGGVHTLYVNCDVNDGDNDSKAEPYDTTDGLSSFAEESGHGGSDFYTMHHFISRIRGNRNADTVDIYEALDMFLPGMFAYLGVLKGGISMDIPNLRDKAEREKWRNDTTCTDPAVAGDMLIPSYSKGNPNIPEENYARLRELLAKEQ